MSPEKVITKPNVDFLKRLISAPGLSGYETPVRQMIEDAWRPLVDELSTSRLGSLHGLRRGTLPDPRPSILLAAHMDAIGLMVTGVVEGLLTLTSIGGLDPRILPGQQVIVHSNDRAGRQRQHPGVIVRPPERLLPADLHGKPPPIEYLLVDIGLAPQRVKRSVSVGDLVSFAQPPLELGEDTLAGHTLDNRASVAALTHCLEALKGRPLRWDVWAGATIQEELNLAGAHTSAFQIHPSLAVAIDVTHADGPGSPGYKTFPMGKGITIGWGPNIHPALYKAFSELAERVEIPWKMEAMPGHSGTDAIAMQVAAEGIPTMVLGIPLRYMHSPVEMVSLKDIARAGRLLAEFVSELDESFLERITWDA
jgi:putative aminopeptidase FrvX